MQLSEAERRSYVGNKVCGHALVQIWLQPMDVAFSEVITAAQSPRQLSSYKNYFPDVVRNKEVVEVLSAVTSELYDWEVLSTCRAAFDLKGGKHS